MNTFDLKILASDKVVYDGKCIKMTIPAFDGEKGILANHENVLMATDVGATRFTKENGEEVELVTGLGFIEVMNNEVLFLVQTSEFPEEIDANRAREAKERAEEALRQKRSLIEYHHSQASLSRAMARLKVTNKHM
jgi:F-type H+-transporting ATPase subunit epsilon